jgi:5'-3' exonuclease
VELHLVDATYELFRAYYAPRPPTRGRDGRNLSGVAGLIETLLALVRDEGATHVGCATDRVIRSFRNDLFPGYKSEVGVPQELLDQFPIAERAIEALGFVLWSMLELEADDALATAVTRWADDPAVDRILICTPDKDMAQLVRDRRVVLRDRRRRITYDDSAVREKWGVPPASIAHLLALVGDSSDGYPGLPGWGAKTAAAVLSRYGTIASIPRRGSQWDVPGVRSAPILAARLAGMEAEAALYLDLATLRTNAELPQRTPQELEWRGARRHAYEALCDELGLDGLRRRPHRWRDD